MKKYNLPALGLRNVKTGISLFVCLASYALAGFAAGLLEAKGIGIPEFLKALISRDTAIYACLAAVVVMGSSVSKSFRSGISRIIGTVIGGVFGSVCLHSGSFLPLDDLDFLIIPVGVVALIYFMVLIKEQDAVVIAVATYLIIVITLDTGAPLLYSVNRVLSTAYGVIVSLCVNYFVRKPKNEEKTENEQEN